MLNQRCSQCGHTETENLLGTLGTVDHFRCRMCGWMWAHIRGEMALSPNNLIKRVRVDHSQ